MALSPELVSRLVKATNDRGSSNKDYAIYGTVVTDGGRDYVRLDGSELSTPFESTVDVKTGDRVIVEVKNHTATITGNVTSPAARTDDVKDLGNKVVAFEKVTTETLVANNATIENLKANKLDANTANLTYATIESLNAANATIETLNATKATIVDLNAANAKIGALEAGKADIADLNAINATIGTLSADVADIDTLIFGSASGTSIQTSFSNAVIAQLGEAQIKSAMIASLAADKISAGSINTNNVTIGSNDGSMVISDETIQITQNKGAGEAGWACINTLNMCDTILSKSKYPEKPSGNWVEIPSCDPAYKGKYYLYGEWYEDSDGRIPWWSSMPPEVVRVQIGKDASGDYSINIWDAEGKLMFSEGGVTDSAIKDAIIRNDMVSNTANISASKLNIASLFTEINNSKETIKSTKIYIDEQSQTLDIAFKQMSSDVSGLSGDVSSQGTQLTAIQGQITSKIWQQDITTAVEAVKTTANEAKSAADSANTAASKAVTTTETLTTNYSELDQQLDKISTTVGEHTTQISKKADGSVVEEVTNKVSSLETGLAGFKSTVSNTYSTKTEVEAIETLANDTQTLANTANTNALNSFDLANDAWVLAGKADSVADVANKTAIDATNAANKASNAANTAMTNANDAYDKANEALTGVTNLMTRIKTAETSIKQTEEEIALRATKSEVLLINNYLNGVRIEWDGDQYYTVDGVMYIKPYIALGSKRLYRVSDIAIPYEQMLGGTMHILLRDVYNGSITIGITKNDIYRLLNGAWGLHFSDVSSTPVFRVIYAPTDNCNIGEINSESIVVPKAGIYFSASDTEIIRVAYIETESKSIVGRISTAETSIVQNAEEIALKAAKTELDALTGRVATAEATISTQAGQIVLKASKQELEAVDKTAQQAWTRAGNAESDVQQALNDISVAESNLSALQNRVIAAEAEISVNADAIAQRVTKTTYNALLNRVTNAETAITQNATAISLKASQSDLDAVELTVSAQGVDITGLTTFKNAAENGTSTVIDGGAIKAATITADQIAGKTITAAEIASDAITSAKIKAGAVTAAKIAAGAIDAEKIKLGEWMTVYKTLSGSTPGGYIGYDSGFGSTYGIGMQAYNSDAECICTDEAARLSWGTSAQFIASESGYAYVDGDPIVFDIDGTDRFVMSDHGTYVSLRPYATSSSSFNYHLGTSSYKWGALYATNGTIQTSDRNEKNSIEDLPEKYLTLFNRLRPVRYKMNEGSSGRYHVGYIAQEVEEAMTAVGIDSLEFGGFVKDKDEAGNDMYMLRYDEFDAIRDAKIKQLEARIEKLEKLLTQNT